MRRTASCGRRSRGASKGRSPLTSTASLDGSMPASSGDSVSPSTRSIAPGMFAESGAPPDDVSRLATFTRRRDRPDCGLASHAVAPSMVISVPPSRTHCCRRLSPSSPSAAGSPFADGTTSTLNSDIPVPATTPASIVVTGYPSRCSNAYQAKPNDVPFTGSPPSSATRGVRSANTELLPRSVPASTSAELEREQVCARGARRPRDGIVHALARSGRRAR